MTDADPCQPLRDSVANLEQAILNFDPGDEDPRIILANLHRRLANAEAALRRCEKHPPPPPQPQGQRQEPNNNVEVDVIRPNEYRLSGHQLEVEYLPNGPDGKVYVSYQDTTRSVAFRGTDQVEVRDTAAGELVSVVIVRTVDVGDTTFSFLIPQVNLDDGQRSAPVQTIGITAIHRTSLAPGFGHGQVDSFSTTQLTGTAMYSKVPVGA